MNKKLFVGNLSPSVTENMLWNIFSHEGCVTRVNLMVEEETGRSRGFAFVRMGACRSAEGAIERLDGQVVDGQPIRVNEAHPPHHPDYVPPGVLARLERAPRYLRDNRGHL